ncbi:MAG: hypothetical protein NUW01_13785 [Gemmatimonadaceae bacterium]|nr:hypothetical protein [Gemmatimonadaceae bacterium]
MLSRDTRNEKKLKAIRRAEFRLKQRLEYIDWEEDDLLPEVTAFKAKAQLPELPNETIVDVTFEAVPDDPGNDQA